jgi:tripartite-type tricarboxylate transporter receptor subunit TctC
VIGTTGTPEAAVAWLNREISRIVKAPEVKHRLESQGYDPVGSSVAAFSAYLASEARKWAKVVKDSGARVE